MGWWLSVSLPWRHPHVPAAPAQHGDLIGVIPMHARAHAVAGRAAVDAFKPDHGLPESAVNVIDPHARGSGCRRSIRPPPLNPKEGLLMAGTTRLIVLLALLGGWLGAVIVL